jgi:hypothetical protein
MLADRFPVDIQFARDLSTRPPARVERDNGLNVRHLE